MSAPVSRHRDRQTPHQHHTSRPQTPRPQTPQQRAWRRNLVPALAPAAVVVLAFVAWIGAEKFGSVRSDVSSSASASASQRSDDLVVPSPAPSPGAGRSQGQAPRPGPVGLSRSQTRMTAQAGRQPAEPSTRSTDRPTGRPDERTPDASPTPDSSPTDDGSANRAPAKPSGNRRLEVQVVDLVNDERAKAGCGPVRSESRLTLAARGHSQDMADNDYFDHASQDGRDFTDRAEAARYQGFAAAENIAAGSDTAAGVMDQWMTSEGHRDNILNCDHTQLGVGLGRGGSYRYYWTQVFGQ
jgi:uncharacterized protein YkwD